MVTKKIANLREDIMIEITAAAQKKLQDSLIENPGKSPRISFSPGGLMGPALKLSFEKIQQGDKEENVDGLHLIVAEDVSYFAQKMIVDYVKDQSFEVEAKEGMICNEDCASCQGCNA